jgi:SRSO17 transposase
VRPGDATPTTVGQLGTWLPAARWTRQTIKEGSKGPLVADFAAVRMITVREGLPGPEVWVVLRRNPLTGELKTYLSNAPAETALAELVRVSGMHWPIETCFEEGKQYLGMGDDEVHSWRGWHHHIPLVRMCRRLKKTPHT